jgi:putative lipoprotein
MKTILIISILLATIFVITGCITTSNLVGDWELVSYGTATVKQALPNVNTFIHFYPDGNFNGNMGCNSFSGKYNLNGDKITFSSIISTEMYCENTSGQETEVLSILSKPDLHYQLSGNTLSITSGLSTINLIKK